VSCFVCNGNGHLASRCPENKQKGIYPNGGSCKLCGETDHLARNCKLRNKGAVDTFGLIVHRNSCEADLATSGKTTFLGTGAEAGADEDDFHTFKRKSSQVDEEQRMAERTDKSRSGIPAQAQQKKKVVNF
jgi:zinc finger CCHC domain-containing protein 9